jgi:Flp pilus assembly protein TadG
MKRMIHALFARFLRNERGQIIPWMALLSALFLGVAGLSVDLGHAYVCYRELQASTDAAALAGAYALGQGNASSASVSDAVDLYAVTPNGANFNTNLPSPTVSVTLSCVTDSTMVAASCQDSGSGNNVVHVTQTATIPTYFIRALAVMGMNTAKSLTLSTTASATMASGANDQVNVAMVFDSTASMAANDTDANCGSTRITCALQGVQTMLADLAPCTASTSQSTATCVPYDQVSLFTYPNIQANSVANDTDCSSKTGPSIVKYTTPVIGATWNPPAKTSSTGTYQLTSYLSDWTASNGVNGALTNNSTLVTTTGGTSSSSCPGVAAKGGAGTWIAGSIYAAQSSLVAAKAAAPGSRNVMIILSDGDASNGSITANNGLTLTSTGVYPSSKDECQQGITAAKYASAHGTTVYTIAYGAASSSSGYCTTDSPAISPCSALQQMSTGYVSSTNAPDFYSDATASQNKGQCTSSSNPNLSLKGIFGNITAQLTKPRLIPNNVT